MGLTGRFDKLEFTDPDNLEKLNCIIHDELLDADDIVYDSEIQALTIPFGRAFHWQDKRQVKINPFRRVWEVPVLRCTLSIKHVQSYTFVDKEHVSRYPFNTIEFNRDSRKITIGTCIPLQLELIVTDFQIEYSEQGFRGKAHISEGWFPFVWESGPRFLPD